MTKNSARYSMDTAIRKKKFQRNIAPQEDPCQQ